MWTVDINRRIVTKCHWEGNSAVFSILGWSLRRVLPSGHPVRKPGPWMKQHLRLNTQACCVGLSGWPTIRGPWPLRTRWCATCPLSELFQQTCLLWFHFPVPSSYGQVVLCHNIQARGSKWPNRPHVREAFPNYGWGVLLNENPTIYVHVFLIWLQ